MNDDFINPIDADKVTDQPSTLSYPHHAGSAVVKPIDQGKMKGRAVSAMEHQTDMQLHQIYEQMQLLAAQATKLNERKKIAEFIYLAEMRFEPLINHTYHLYQRDNGGYVLSMIGPNQWGKSKAIPTFMATIKLLADHTWDIVEKNPSVEFGI
jgi:hypothetical protein